MYTYIHNLVRMVQIWEEDDDLIFRSRKDPSEIFNLAKKLSDSRMYVHSKTIDSKVSSKSTKKVLWASIQEFHGHQTQGTENKTMLDFVEDGFDTDVGS